MALARLERTITEDWEGGEHVKVLVQLHDGSVVPGRSGARHLDGTINIFPVGCLWTHKFRLKGRVGIDWRAEFERRHIASLHGQVDPPSQGFKFLQEIPPVGTVFEYRHERYGHIVVLQGVNVDGLTIYTTGKVTDSWTDDEEIEVEYSYRKVCFSRMTGLERTEREYKWKIVGYIP